MGPRQNGWANSQGEPVPHIVNLSSPFLLSRIELAISVPAFAHLRRKALQPFLQTFATAPAKHCNRSRKRLREKAPSSGLYTLYIYIIREQYGNLICTGFVSSGHVSMARHSYPHKKQERERSIIPLSHSIPANAWIFHPTARSVWADAYSSP